MTAVNDHHVLKAWAEVAIDGLLADAGFGGDSIHRTLREPNLWRLSRWRGLAARHDALVLVLHLGFLFAALDLSAIDRTRCEPR